MGKYGDKALTIFDKSNGHFKPLPEEYQEVEWFSFRTDKPTSSGFWLDHNNAEMTNIEYEISGLMHSGSDGYPILSGEFFRHRILEFDIASRISLLSSIRMEPPTEVEGHVSTNGTHLYKAKGFSIRSPIDPRYEYLNYEFTEPPSITDVYESRLDGFYYNGKLICKYPTGYRLNLAADIPVVLLSHNDGFKFRYLKMWSNGQLVMELVPCYKKRPLNTPFGLYDVVSDNLHEASYSNSTYGPGVFDVFTQYDLPFSKKPDPISLGITGAKVGQIVAADDDGTFKAVDIPKDMSIAKRNDKLPKEYEQRVWVALTDPRYEISLGLTGGKNCEYELKGIAVPLDNARPIRKEEYLFLMDQSVYSPFSLGALSFVLNGVQRAGYRFITSLSYIHERMSHGGPEEIDTLPDVYQALVNGYYFNGIRYTSPENYVPGAELTWGHISPRIVAEDITMRIYYLKMWEDGKLVRDLIPCVEKQSLNVGLYDIVGNHFYRYGDQYDAIRPELDKSVGWPIY